jgi:hypothetical protein
MSKSRGECEWSGPCGWEQKSNFFGEHVGITCDGCGIIPMFGYRYRCRNCPNHDVCEACHERWDNGKGSMANGLAKQTISLDPKDHDFFVHKEKGFKPLVKQQGPTAKSEKKLKVGERRDATFVSILSRRRNAFVGGENIYSSSSSSFFSHLVRVCWLDPANSPTTRARAGTARSSRSAAARKLSLRARR